jgi:hypothetical protein
LSTHLTVMTPYNTASTAAPSASHNVFVAFIRYLPKTKPNVASGRRDAWPEDIHIKPSEASAAKKGRRQMRAGFKPLFF